MKSAVLLLAVLVAGAATAAAEPPPPRIGLFVVDLHGIVPLFPNDSPQLADSRGLNLAELPGHGFGGTLGAHVYLLRWRAITFGVGGEIAFARAHQQPGAPNDTGLRPVSERFVSAAPQLSFNFGTGRGWSYLSGGIGQSLWSLHPDGAAELTADQERLKTINYGGGARWFAKKHLAFSLDVRFYAIDPGAPLGGLPGSPRTTLVSIGAGISVK